MTHYRATFSDGSTNEIKNSKREYGFGYRVWGESHSGERRLISGFAKTREAAERYAHSESKGLREGVKGRSGAFLIPAGKVHRTEVVPVEIDPI